MEALLPVYDKILMADPESLPFRQAVDPDALGIPVIQLYFISSILIIAAKQPPIPAQWLRQG